jgi:hypothetical protein
MNPAKVQSIHDWPASRSVRAVRGFLGLVGYYRKFVHNYDTVAAPLTVLLKKDGFTWDEAATVAFSGLKAVVTSDPVLAMLDFAKLFVVECCSCKPCFPGTFGVFKFLIYVIKSLGSPRVVRVPRQSLSPWVAQELCGYPGSYSV